VVVYFKAVAHVAPLEVLAHRILWSVVLLSLLMSMQRRWTDVRAALRSRRNIATLLCTTVLVAGNWFVFIWAIGHDHVVQASLGYYINPLVNVFLGFLLLRERLRPWQWLSVILAGVAVGYLTLGLGKFPWIALFLAFSFGCYGLLRKTAAVDSMLGLTIETSLLLPPALAYLAYLAFKGSIAFTTISPWTDALLVFAGVVTAMPLLWFTRAARRLRYATVGFMQYIAPSLQLLLGVTVYGEPFTIEFRITFSLIWLALAIYSIDAVRAHRPPVAGQVAAS
jgi:chloramphenicol-sensitive protein RarD